MKNGVIKTNYLKERITIIPNFSDLEMFSNFDKKSLKIGILLVL